MCLSHDFTHVCKNKRNARRKIKADSHFFKNMATPCLREEEILAEKVCHFPILYDKKVKGFKERDVVCLKCMHLLHLSVSNSKSSSSKLNYRQRNVLLSTNVLLHNCHVETAWFNIHQ